MKICDFCGKNIVGIKQINCISDKENIWNKSYKLLHEAKLSKINSKLKKLWFYYSYEPNMPIYYPHGIHFCDDVCYSKWKKIFNSKIKEELAKIKGDEKL